MSATALARSIPEADVVLSGASFGLAPTFWTFERGCLQTFQSAADAAASTSQVNVERLSALICGASPLDDEASLFQNVHRVPHGARVIIDARGGRRVVANHRALSLTTLAPVDAADEIWRGVCASVRRAIDGARRVAVLTGGGVDSGALLGAVIAACRGASKCEVMAIALHFGGEGDDRPYLCELEQSLGIEAIRVAPGDAANDMRMLLDHGRMPIWAPGSAGDLSLFRRARALSADVVLTGIGGDDLFDGYPRLLADDVARGDVGAALFAARLQVPWRSTVLDRVSDFVARPIVARAVPPNIQHARRRRLRRSRWPWAGPALLDFIDGESARWERPRLDTPSARFDFLSKAFYLADVVELSDELAKIATVKVAHPYLDDALLELTSSLPPRTLMHAGRLRGLFRLAVRGRIPDSLRFRDDKASFANARRAMLRAAGGVETIADLATMTKCADLGLVDPERFRVAFEAFPRDLEQDDTAWTWIWPALAIEGFLRARAREARA